MIVCYSCLVKKFLHNNIELLEKLHFKRLFKSDIKCISCCKNCSIFHIADVYYFRSGMKKLDKFLVSSYFSLKRRV